jgi:hypothetical protein
MLATAAGWAGPAADRACLQDRHVLGLKAILGKNDGRGRTPRSRPRARPAPRVCSPPRWRRSSARQGSRSSIHFRKGTAGLMRSSAEREASPGCAAALGSLAAKSGERRPPRLRCGRDPHTGIWGVPPRREGKESSGLERGLNSCPSRPSVVLQPGRFIGGTTDRGSPFHAASRYQSVRLRTPAVAPS